MKTLARSACTLIEIMIVVAIIGMHAAVAIPGIRRSVDRAQKQACALNRKSIDGVKAQWAPDHKKPVTKPRRKQNSSGQPTTSTRSPIAPPVAAMT